MVRWLGLFAAVLALSVPSARHAWSAEIATELKFAEFYVDDFSVEFSARLKALAGKRVQVRGFMAPPLKPDASFVVLTRDPVYLCPFCQTDEEWPLNILAVYIRPERISLGEPVGVAGTLEIGSKIDPQTGFVSLVRLVNASIVP